MIIFRSDKTLDSVRKPTEQTERLRKAYSDFTLCWLHDIVPQIAPLQLSLRSNQFNLWNSASFNIEKWSKFRWTFSISILNWTARGLWELAANSKYCKPTIKDTIATLLALLCRGSDWCFNGGLSLPSNCTFCWEVCRGKLALFDEESFVTVTDSNLMRMIFREYLKGANQCFDTDETRCLEITPPKSGLCGYVVRYPLALRTLHRLLNKRATSTVLLIHCLRKSHYELGRILENRGHVIKFQ